jgi:hypothetical protein
MSKLDYDRKLVMTKFKTVLGHNLTAGTPLVITDKPIEAGQIDRDMADRLFGGGLAVYAEDFHPTPVETAEQEAARLLRGGTASPDLTEGEIDPPQIEVQADLVTWQEDNPTLGKTAGQKVTKDDLLAIAELEEDAVESDDNKADLQRKIMEARASRAPATDEAPHTEIIGG